MDTKEFYILLAELIKGMKKEDINKIIDFVRSLRNERN